MEIGAVELSNRLEAGAVEESEGIAPAHATNIALRWNESRITIWKVSATCLCVLVMGANDAAYGAIIPYVGLRSRA